MDLLRVHADDNVLVALRDLEPGSVGSWEDGSLRLPEGVRAKHKVAAADLGAGDAIVMYGVLVGRTTRAIARGVALATDNVEHASGGFAVTRSRRSWTPPDVGRWRERRFLGFHRADGRVGTANHWLVMPLVFCENRNATLLAKALREQLGYARPDTYGRQVAELVRRFRREAGSDHAGRGHAHRERVFPNVSGVQLLTHQLGCGGTDSDARALCALLAGYLANPNVAGATVLALGCEKAQVSLLREQVERAGAADKPALVFEQQRSSSESAMLAEAIDQTFAGLQDADRLERRPAPLARLTLGMECGGSDGFSGISANPVMGRVADLIVALGGRVLLSEFPELCGVEQELIERCSGPEVAERFVALMRAYAEHAAAVGAGFDTNPSPGNVRDGLITGAMKSAGAARKGGSSPVTAALDYAEHATRPGLNLLCTPGNDVESTTGLAGAGANLILFSTGMGTPTGNPVTPVIKLSSNTGLARRLPDIIDFDAGPVVTGERSIGELAEDLLELVVRVASGEVEPHAVRLSQDDFIPWKRGVSL
jgi:altronate hydrolase